MRISDWSSDVCSSVLFDADIDLRTAVTLARGTSATAIKIYADLPAERVAAITAEAHRQKMMIWAHSATFPARPAEVIAAGPAVISTACYPGYEEQPNLPAAYEHRHPSHATPPAPPSTTP